MGTLGNVAYKAYGDSVGWVAVSGERMPEYASMPNERRVAWEKAAAAVVGAVTMVHVSPGCACGVTHDGTYYVDPLCESRKVHHGSDSTA